MAEEEFIGPTEGNPALDPTRVGSGLVGSFETLDREAKEKISASRPLIEADRQKNSLDEYWAKRSADKDASKRSEKSKRASKVGERRSAINEGGGGGSSRVASSMQSLLGNDYAVMKFKSPTMQMACESSAYTCTFPVHGYLPQVCGPYRPISASYHGGMPQSGIHEATGTGYSLNRDG